MLNKVKMPSERQRIKVLSRAVTILHYLSQKTGVVSISDIARNVDLPRSTVQRIVDALADEGILITGLSKSGVRLGPALLPMGEIAKNSIVEIAHPILKLLAEETGESVVLTTMNEDMVNVLSYVQGSNRLVSILESGSQLPLHCSASGKAILANSDPDILKALQKNKLKRFTDNTIVSWEELKEVLASIQETGFSWDNEEHSYGICSAAVAIRYSGDGLLSLAVTAPSERCIPDKDRIISLLKAHASTLQGMLTNY